MTQPGHQPHHCCRCTCTQSEAYDIYEDPTRPSIRFWGPVGAVFFFAATVFFAWAGLYGWLGDGMMFSDDHESRTVSSAFCGMVSVVLLCATITDIKATYENW